ncbi:MAG: hypothetical protein E7360_04180 [Clostridiales bacterium]|nr:hypothetical protein [Clostridiales bacterium]
MEKDFAIGLILGMIGGALIVANSYQARKMVKDGQEQIKNKVCDMTKKKQQSNDYEDLDD